MKPNKGGSSHLRALLTGKPPTNRTEVDEAPGPSSSGHHTVEDDETEEITQQLLREEQALREQQGAVASAHGHDDPNFRDPLDYIDSSSFNILQFLSENDSESPANSPANAARGQRLHNGQGNNGRRMEMDGSCFSGNSSASSSKRQSYVVNNQRLPDSPPNTDISAAGSSGSPSTNSDSPYSPDYSNYAGLHLNNGLNIGDFQQHLQGGMLEHANFHPPVAMQPPGTARCGSGYGQGPSPPLFSPYPSGHSQISPPAAAMATTTQQQFQHYDTDVFQNIVASAGNDMPSGLADNSNRKRRTNSNESGASGTAHYVTQQPLRFENKRIKSEMSMSPSMAGTPCPTIDPSHFVTHASMDPRGAYGMNPMQPSPLGGGDSYMDENFHGTGEVIKFSRFGEDTWMKIYDAHRNQCRNLNMHVVADKGFNYNAVDGCFVNQKKNHFQISVNVEAGDDHPIEYVAVDGQLALITHYSLAFCGVKSEMPSCEIPIRQSKNDRKPIPHDPVKVEKFPARHQTKVTVPRMHFGETTLNNQRKQSRPNPEQKYFLLLVRMVAHTVGGGQHLIMAYASEKVIVRLALMKHESPFSRHTPGLLKVSNPYDQATNPGQFEPPDVDVSWGKSGPTLFTQGPVAIGMSNQMNGAMLSVNGDIFHAGSMNHPSDRRLKDNIEDIDKAEALRRLQELRLVSYAYKKEIADQWGLSEASRNRVGVIAQELAEVNPAAVKLDGEFLTIDESRMFFDNIAATQELCRINKDMEGKIDDNKDELQKAIGKIWKKKPDDCSTTTSTTNIADTTSTSALSDFKKNSELAGSRYSLASTFKRELAKNQCANPHCKGYEPTLCSSKITQFAIAGLVIVMAFCLLAMSALYVMDWHHRNYGLHYIPPPSPPGEFDKHENRIIHKLRIPMRQPDAPALHALCTHVGCESYCCKDRHHYNTEPKHGFLAPGIDVVPLAGSRQSFLSAIAGAEEMNPKAFFPKPLQSGVRITMLGMNITIDDRYCVSPYCNPRRGRYNLMIPMSPYLPNSSLYLRFEPPAGQFVSSCGKIAEFQEMACEGERKKDYESDGPVINEMMDNVFEVTAGQFKRSAYRFRIGRNADTCYGSPFAGEFEEYNLIFYRTCDMPHIVENPVEKTPPVTHYDSGDSGDDTGEGISS